MDLETMPILVVDECKESIVCAPIVGPLSGFPVFLLNIPYGS